jgi:chaperone required for assembly of F1-ATPase
MRDLFEGIFDEEPDDPTRAVRRAMRRELRQRFYARVEVDEAEEEFRILLDGQPVKTPARHTLAAPSRALAQQLAREWEAQGEAIEPAGMPLTRLANTIIDGVVDAPGPVAAEVERYLACDLVFYRAPGPAGLVLRQAKAWDPVLAWAREAMGARFVLAEGIAFVAQPAQSLAAASSAIPRHPWRLGAVHTITTLTGSALIAIALARAAVSLDAAWTAAHVDEDWNMEFWGRDAIALERRTARFAEMQAAAAVLEAIK